MDQQIDMDDDREAAAAALPSDAVIRAIAEILAIAGRYVVAKAARRCGGLATLRRIVSLVSLVLFLVIRAATRFSERFVKDVSASIDRARRDLTHPPQAWAAP